MQNPHKITSLYTWVDWYIWGMDEKSKLWIAFVSSFVLSMIAIMAKSLVDNCKARREKREFLRNELFACCEKMQLLAFYANSRCLESRYRYAMHKINPDEDFDKSSYLKFFDKAEDYGLEYDLLKVEIRTKMPELDKYWDVPAEAREIKRLLRLNSPNPVLRYDGVFNKEMSEDVVLGVYKKKMEDVARYINEESYCKNLIKIQEILEPLIMRERLNKL